MDGWVSLLNNFGVSVAALGIIVAGIWKFCSVFWRDIIVPVRDRFLRRMEAFFDKLETALAAIEERGKKDDSATRKIIAGVELSNDQLKELRSLWEQYKDIWLQTSTGRRQRPLPPRQPPPAAGAP